MKTELLSPVLQNWLVFHIPEVYPHWLPAIARDNRQLQVLKELPVFS
jgi:hypothetical protein